METPELVRIPTFFQGPVIGAVVNSYLERFHPGLGNEPGCFCCIGRMQIDRQFAAHPAAHELIHRHVQCFARQIPERHLHSADGREVRSAHTPHEKWRGRTAGRKMLPTPQVE
jgi:hypothetical protein